MLYGQEKIQRVWRIQSKKMRDASGSDTERFGE